MYYITSHLSFPLSWESLSFISANTIEIPNQIENDTHGFLLSPLAGRGGDDVYIVVITRQARENSSQLDWESLY